MTEQSYSSFLSRSNSAVGLAVEAGLSSVLFHITSARNAANILTKDRFELKPSDGSEAEEALNRSYYLSCARSITSDYIKSSLYGNFAILQLDGRKLSTKYKGAPVDYWNNRTYKSEMEDRVLAPTEFIPATPYVSAIHSVFKEDTDPRFFYPIKYRCALKKIPCFFYPTVEALRTLRPSAQVVVPLSRLKPVSEDTPTPNEYSYKYRGRKDQNLAAWLALYSIPAPTSGDLWAFIKDQDWGTLLSVYKTVGYPSDRVTQLKNEMHNAKSDRYESIGKNREYLDKMVRVLRKEQWTPEQFCDFLFKKWYGR